jgi:hypothetical protein
VKTGVGGSGEALNFEQICVKLRSESFSRSAPAAGRVSKRDCGKSVGFGNGMLTFLRTTKKYNTTKNPRLFNTSGE